MPDDIPVAAAYLFLVVVAFLRGGATYAVGRLARGAGARAERTRRLLERPGMARAEQVVSRWGAPVVAVSFLTVGFQSLVNAAAGVLQMPLRRYLPGLLVGALIWAGIYVTIGLAVLQAWMASKNGLWLIGAVLAVALVTGLTTLLRRRWRQSEEP
ncbi:MAG: VTT domain-containing protein [Marmoricola sp.]